MPSKPHADLIPVPAILLAAGASTRLGQPKQLLRLPAFGGKTLLDHAVSLAREAGLAPIFVVLGAHADEIHLACELLDCILIRNQAWAEGMASSLRVGIAAVLENAPAASGAMVLVCDQPGLSAEHLVRLLDAHALDRKPHRGVSLCGTHGCAGNLSARIISGVDGVAGRSRRARVAAKIWNERGCD